MLGVDAPERVELSGARRLAALGRGAELLQVQVGDAFLVEGRGELALGKPGFRDAATARVSTKSFTLARLSSAISASGLAFS